VEAENCLDAIKEGFPKALELMSKDNRYKYTSDDDLKVIVEVVHEEDKDGQHYEWETLAKCDKVIAICESCGHKDDEEKFKMYEKMNGKDEDGNDIFEACLQSAGGVWYGTLECPKCLSECIMVADSNL